MDGLCASLAISGSYEFLSLGVLELIATAISTGFLLALIRGPAALISYQKKVERLMASSASSGEAKPTGLSRPDEVVERSEDSTTLHSRVSSNELHAEMIGIRQRSYHAVLAMMASFGIMIFPLYTLSEMVANERSFDSSFDWLVSALYSAVGTFVIIAPLAMVGFKEQKSSRVLATIALTLFGALCLYKVSLDEDNIFVVMLLGIVGVVTMLAIYTALISRQLRNIVPLYTLSIGMIALMFFLPLLVASLAGSCDSAVMLILAFSALIAVWKLRSMLIKGLVKGYTHRLYSNRQLQIGVWLTVIAAFLILDISPGESSLVSHWSYFVLIAYTVSISIYFYKQRSIGNWSKPVPLLLLRVFSRDKIIQGLLDDITSDWSCIGPIHLVGGPDLAKTYLDPDECLLFMQDRMSDGFIVKDGDLEHRISRLRDLTDPDGRYRINEFFCTVDTWQQTVAKLVDKVDVVLLDLRAFDKTRDGAAYELKLLASMDAIGKTVILTDSRTETDLLDKALLHVPRVKKEAAIQLKMDPNTNRDVVLRKLMQIQEMSPPSKG